MSCLSASTLSHMMRTLEARMGVRLFNRTTRSVSTTEAGERLLVRLQPVLHDLDRALDEVGNLNNALTGRLRINASDQAVKILLKSVVPSFLARYPGVALDLVSDGRLVDIVEEGFDTGIRLGEFLEQDMIAVRLGGYIRFITVAAPDYLARKGTPQIPDQLKDHDCIRIRMPSGKHYRWEFEKAGQELVVDVPGALTLGDVDLMVTAAARGLGIAYVPDTAARDRLDGGALVTVLEDWCPAIPGLYLYYPGHRHVPMALRAFIDIIKEQDAG
jgi:DNA-binding transcriptional LysR family regulator